MLPSDGMHVNAIRDPAELSCLAETLGPAYRAAEPFPHAVIEGLFEDTLLRAALNAFPGPAEIAWYRYDNPLERKLATNRLAEIPSVLVEVLKALNAKEFVAFLETLTDIPGLVPDDHYVGGGLHQIEPGGKLDVHVDFNYHPVTRLDRRVNALLYLNEDWKEEYGGHLELWDAGLTRAVRRVLPVFNRLVVFNATELAYHGHPEPLACPDGWTRKSLAAYYYTDGRPEAERRVAHSAVFVPGPSDASDPSLDALRARRVRGRLADLSTRDGVGGAWA